MGSKAVVTLRPPDSCDRRQGRRLDHQHAILTARTGYSSDTPFVARQHIQARGGQLRLPRPETSGE